MNVKKLTGKKVKVGIKNGMTIQDFCEKYECIPADLWARIGQLFTVRDTARQIWHEIEANEKKRKPRVVAKETVVVADATEETTEDETVDEAPHVPTIDELKASEADYSDVVMELEKTWKDLHQERDKGREDFQRLREEMRELKKEHDAKWCEAEKIIQRDNELVDRMNEIRDTHNVKQRTLEEIRSQIKELSKIVLCVYSSREIAPFDEAVEITLDDTGHDELFSHLREQEEAEDFRPKDLRVVARIIKIVANLSIPVEIIFEDEEIKRAYEVFMKSA